MMRRTFRTVLLLLSLWTCVTALAADDLAQRYETLRKAYQSLRADAERRTYRHHWENLIGKLDRLLEASPPPNAQLDARIRFTLGSAWRELYDQSHVKSDLAPAKAVLTELVKRHPESSLADDALYQLGEVEIKGGDSRHAREHLLRILNDYSEGDRIDEAQFLLSKLQAAEPAVAEKPVGKSEKRPENASSEVKSEKRPENASNEAKSEKRPENASSEVKTDNRPEIAPIAAKSEKHPENASSEAKAEKRPEKAKNEVRSGLEKGEAAELTSIKVWKNPDYTRLSLHLTGVSPAHDSRISDVKPGSPSQVIIDLPKTALGEAFEKTLTARGDKGEGYEVPVSGGLLEATTVRRRTDGGIRLTLTVERLHSYRVSHFESPHRILVDLFGDVGAMEETDDLEKLVLNLPAKAVKAAKKGPPAARRYTIVVDAGHGGDDPGAPGPAGSHEKDVTLSIAMKVQKKLSTLPGVQVIMTRDSDVFVPLEDRTTIANQQKADLFISIHANASPKATNRGLETYYLDTASDEGAEKLATRENATLKNKSELDVILQDLIIEGNVRYSSRLARSVHDSILSALRLQYPPKSVKDLGVKTALFYVLFGAQMPAILVETAFISNSDEETRLNSEVYQTKLADAVKTGVKRYIHDTRTLSRAEEK